MYYHLERAPDIAASLDEIQHECLITLALKIVDDTCKMNDYERSVFMTVYDSLPLYKSNIFDEEVFDLISKARNEPSARIYAAIRPLREAGMEYVTRLNMKAFKAAVREQLLK